MAWNTGTTSVGDSLITARISAVAVCRSSASFVSSNSRAFSSATPMPVAMVWSRLTSASPKAPSRSKLCNEMAPSSRLAEKNGTMAVDRLWSVPAMRFRPKAAISAALFATTGRPAASILYIGPSRLTRVGAIDTLAPC